jgi:RNA polymerase sigma-70 factor, ECF subfamily
LTKSKTYTHDELVAEVKARNQKAFAYLYDNYSKALFNTIYAIVQSEEEAEDVLQNTFVKVWNSFDLYDINKGRLYTWMLNIARNMAIDSTRSKHGKMQSKIQSTNNPVYQQVKLVESVAEHLDAIGLNTFLAGLKDDQKELIQLAYYEGYTQEELAKKLNIPLGTVKTKIRQALMTLREMGKAELKQTGQK